MKFTLLITQRCNLACGYCYIGKRDARISLETASRTIDFIFRTAPPGEPIDLGFFGGEPFLEFDLLKSVTEIVMRHPRYDAERVEMNVVTNGTILTAEIVDFLNSRNILYCLSLDGPPHVHDRTRRFADGTGSSSIIEANVRRALAAFPAVLVNAVYGPETVRHLPEVVEYFSALGLRRIYLNPDVTARWGRADAEALAEHYGAVGRLYAEYLRRGDPHFISLIDGKVLVLLRGGYQALERCHMGTREFAFTPDGGIYPCERLIGAGGEEHRIGTVFDGIVAGHRACRRDPGATAQPECAVCGLSPYCMYWCGCTNHLMTGEYDRVHPFLCASERASLAAARELLECMEDELKNHFVDHVSGRPMSNVGARVDPGCRP
jgi:uncharacterized protein